MASVRSFAQSQYWYACFSVADGSGRLKQVQRSTKETDRRRATKIAEKWESAARNRLTEAQARKVISEIYTIANPGETLIGSNAKEWFGSWARNKLVETRESTAARYKRACDQFISFLGPRAQLDINSISSRDVLKFRDFLATKLSAASVNGVIKIIRMALKDALAQGLCLTNVASSVKAFKSADPPGARRSFTLDELKRIHQKADGEWPGLILFGLYTGQRLGDISRLTWQNVDLERREIALVSRKTGRRVLIPMAEPLRGYLLEQALASDDPRQPLFPNAASAKRTSTLSNQFYQIMVAAGLAEKRKHQSTGKGRDSKRKFNETSFHALRHTATSWMKNAGISPAVVQDIIGHDSPAVSAHYTHIDEAAKRNAIDALARTANF